MCLHDRTRVREGVVVSVPGTKLLLPGHESYLDVHQYLYGSGMRALRARARGFFFLGRSCL